MFHNKFSMEMDLEIKNGINNKKPSFVFAKEQLVHESKELRHAPSYSYSCVCKNPAFQCLFF